MGIRVSIVGATGYSGAELTALLARHPGAEVVGVHGSGTRAFGDLHPALGGAPGPALRPVNLDEVLAAQPRVAFLATPHEASAELGPALLAAGVRVIDLSGAFRLVDPLAFEHWYGFPHPAPEWLPKAVYGLTEWAGEELERAELVANPGCYPTAIQLALRPLLELLAPGEVIICDAKSGVSGAGKKADLAYSFTELAGNFKAYGLAGHRHEPEIRAGLGLAADAPFVFVPHLLPVPRGILATLHVALAPGVGAEDLAAAYALAYHGAPLVRVRPAGQLPELGEVVGTPRCELGFALLPAAGAPRRAVVVAVLDNLLKGAASQAVQNFNRMIGAAETEGLS